MQAFMMTQWNVHGKPAWDVVIQKVVHWDAIELTFHDIVLWVAIELTSHNLS